MGKFKNLGFSNFESNNQSRDFVMALLTNCTLLYVTLKTNFFIINALRMRQ